MERARSRASSGRGGGRAPGGGGGGGGAVGQLAGVFAASDFDAGRWVRRAVGGADEDELRHQHGELAAARVAAGHELQLSVFRHYPQFISSSRQIQSRLAQSDLVWDDN
jgi:2-oxo-4-hydroxy-4-carboxy--5-ureidoimidazoline (OHCU) decarboxylase